MAKTSTIHKFIPVHFRESVSFPFPTGLLIHIRFIIHTYMPTSSLVQPSQQKIL